MATKKIQSELPDAKVSLSDVLIAFQKSLARSQSHSASVRRTPDFFLGRRPLLEIDGLEVDLKVGLSVDSPEDDSVRVNFTPTDNSTSSLRFRVSVKPLDIMETGVVLFRSIDPATPQQICVVSIAEGRATPGSINLHIVTRLIQTPRKTSGSTKSAGKKDADKATPEAGTISWDEDAGTLSLWGIFTDNTGSCLIVPSISQGKLVLTINGQDSVIEKPDARRLKEALIYASVGSATSERINLFSIPKS